MKILVIGSGAREHAIAAAIDSEGSHEVCVSPGNAGIAQTINCVQTTFDADLISIAKNFDLVVIGPEGPLAGGLVDRLKSSGATVFGPSQAAARIETSKHFAKEIMANANVRTAKSVLVNNVDDLSRALKASSRPYVVKADGIAAGKGAIVTGDRDAAYRHGSYWIRKGPVLLEEYVKGREVSLFFLCDGRVLVPLSPAKDYKRLGESDTGPNTGGMGSHSPVTDLPANFVEEVQEAIAYPVIKQMAACGIVFRGLLYCGLALCDDGPKVIEFNARFGDPETQVILPRLTSSLSELLYATAKGDLRNISKPSFNNKAAVCVVIASGGYPEIPAGDTPIIGLNGTGDVQVLFAGARRNYPDEPDILHSHGGRIMNIVSLDKTFAKAREKAYRAVDQISITNKQFRRDIALEEEFMETNPLG
ncbi:phosphoribosylamine--glycine ligase [Tropheryma whipplei]|uniref:phosphoribosylamine--glycine ligase n=1 Tax=Tropheryma whipplei TaxID=2039 RepID=UPI0004B8D445|nr:phosphoribosylamine--glycine ligase [Tropheryma whipplei]